jgi:hypothetical protein
MERPYRLYDAKANEFLRWRCYKHHLNAHRAALNAIRWAKVGAVIEVVNHQSGRALVAYRLHATGHISWS